MHRAIAYAVAKPDMTAGAGGVDGAPRPWRRCHSMMLLAAVGGRCLVIYAVSLRSLHAIMFCQTDGATPRPGALHDLDEVLRADPQNTMALRCQARHQHPFVVGC